MMKEPPFRLAFMKKILLLTYLGFFISSLGAQTTCRPVDRRLSANELSTTINPLYLWWDGSDAQFNFPKNESTSMVFAGGLWLTAQYPDGVQESSVTVYGAAIDQFDFQTGPVGTGGSFTSSIYFCRSFKVTKQEIVAHLADLADGTLDNPISSIMEWPGRDNALLPVTAMGRDLAPFQDVDGNGRYQPALGDYPMFNADEAVWWVTNDFGPHNESPGSGVGAEVQVLAQAFEAPDHPASKAQLYTVKVINAADVTLDSLALSLWIDPDVGCFTDDAIGSLPSHDAVFAYNIDAIDGTNGAACDLGISTYADKPPMIFFQTLSAFLDGAVVSTRNSGISLNSRAVDGLPSTYQPTIREEYFNVTHARWLDREPLTFGNLGVGGTLPTNWIFSGNPSDSLAWSQCQNYSAIDRRLLLNVNLQDSFEEGAEFSVDFLVSIISDVPLPCPDLTTVIPTLDSIVDFVQNTVVSSNRTPRVSFKELSLKPNPAKDAFSVSMGYGEAVLQTATLYDGLGRAVEQYGAASLSGSIDVTPLPRGVYSLVAEDAKGDMYRSRVVLQ